MKQKILTICIMFVMIFSYSLIVFADEEVQTITITGLDSNTYTLIPYNDDEDGNTFLFYDSESNEINMFVFLKPVELTISGSYFRFTTIDSSTDNKRYCYIYSFNSESMYFDTYRQSGTYNFSKTYYNLSIGTLSHIATFENTDSLRISSEDTTPEEDTNTSTNTNTTTDNTNTNTDNNTTTNTNTNVDTGNTTTNTTTGSTEINNQLSKIYEGIQFIVSFFCLASVVLLVYIVYKFLLMFFTL